MDFRLINRFWNRGARRKLSAVTNVGLFLALAVGGPSFVHAQNRLVPDSAESFFFMPGESRTLVFTVEGDEDPASIEYRVREYDGGERYRSSASVEEGVVEISLVRRAGYHEIYFPASDQVFGLGVIPPFEGERDGFFGIDAGLSWFAGEGARGALIANLSRGGVAVARERFDWNAANPRRGYWNWHARRTNFHPFPGGYERVRMTFDEYGIEVVDPFFSAPSWIRASEERHAFPDDLSATSDSWGAVATRWGNFLGGVETWNKPDQEFGRYLPADQYVPVVRAVRHGIDASGEDVPLGGGGFATVNRPYLDLAAHNGLLDEVDFVSFHFGGDPLWMEERVAAYRDWLRAFDRESMPLWITESSVSRADYEGRPAGQIERSRAMRYTMNVVEARAAGVARHFPGVYPHSGADVGMTNESGAPLRSLIAYFQAIRVLAHREYAGDLSSPIDGLGRARVFLREGEEALIVLYTGHPTWNQAVGLPFDIVRAAGVDGRELDVSGRRSLTVSDGLAYVWAAVPDVEEHLDRDTRAAELYAAARGTPKERAPVSSVILQAFPGIDRETFANQVGYYLSGNSAEFTLPVRVHNLGRRSAVLELEARDSNGDPGAAGFGSRRVDVPGNGFTDVSFGISPLSLGSDAGLSRLEIRASESSGGRVAPLVVNLLVPGRMDDLVARYNNSQSLPLREMERRAELSTSGGVEGVSMFVTRDGHLRISGGFPDAGRSALRLDLPVPRDVIWSDVEAVLLRVRFERPAMARLGIRTDYGTVHYAVNRMIKADGEWGVFLFPLNTDHFQVHQGVNDHQVQRMRNGLFPLRRITFEMTHLDDERSDNVLEIRDILFLGGPAETTDSVNR